MEQNPVSIVFVVGAMALVVLGVMQFLLVVVKKSDNKRNELMDEVETLTRENLQYRALNEKLIETNKKLIEANEEYEKMIRKYKDFAAKMYQKYKKRSTEEMAIFVNEKR